MLLPSNYRAQIKSVTANAILLQSITVLHETDFTPVGGIINLMLVK